MIDVFFRLWTPLEKNADHADAGLQPAATSRFRLRRTAPAAALWSLNLILGQLMRVWNIFMQLQSGCGSSSRVERARATSCAAVRLRLCGLRFFQLWQRWENIIRKMWAVKIYFFRTKIIFSDIRIVNLLFHQKIGKILRFPIWPIFGFNSF